MEKTESNEGVIHKELLIETTKLNTQMGYVASSFEKGSKRMDLLQKAINELQQSFEVFRRDYAVNAQAFHTSPCPFMNLEVEKTSKIFESFRNELEELKRKVVTQVSIVGTASSIIGLLIGIFGRELFNFIKRGGG